MQNQKIHVCLWFGKFDTVVKLICRFYMKSLIFPSWVEHREMASAGVLHMNLSAQG